MKIFFDNVDFDSQTGPNTFATRLAKQLTLDGYTIADKEDYDVALCIIRSTDKLNRDKPFVLRLDGIYVVETEQHKNKKIEEGARRHLSSGGRLFLETGSSQGPALEKIFSDGDIWRDFAIIKDYNVRDRVVVVTRV